MKFYLQLLDHGAATGETAPLKAWSDKTCKGCTRLIQRFDTIRAAGGAYSGDFAYTSVKSVNVKLNKSNAARVIFTAKVGRHTVLPKPGGTPTTYTGAAVRWSLTLLAQKGQWIAYDVREDK